MFQDAVEGRFSKAPMIEMTLPSSLDKTISPPGTIHSFIDSFFNSFNNSSYSFKQIINNISSNYTFIHSNAFIHSFKLFLINISPRNSLSNFFKCIIYWPFLEKVGENKNIKIDIQKISWFNLLNNLYN